MMNTARVIATEFGPVVAGKEEPVCELVKRNGFGTSRECIANSSIVTHPATLESQCPPRTPSGFTMAFPGRHGGPGGAAASWNN